MSKKLIEKFVKKYQETSNIQHQSYKGQWFHYHRFLEASLVWQADGRLLEAAFLSDRGNSESAKSKNYTIRKQ